MLSRQVALSDAELVRVVWSAPARIGHAKWVEFRYLRYVTHTVIKRTGRKRACDELSLFTKAWQVLCEEA